MSDTILDANDNSITNKDEAPTIEEECEKIVTTILNLFKIQIAAEKFYAYWIENPTYLGVSSVRVFDQQMKALMLPIVGNDWVGNNWGAEK